jgi:hypothetical protein
VSHLRSNVLAIFGSISLSIVLAACGHSTSRPEQSAYSSLNRTGQVSGTPIEASDTERYEPQPGVHYDLPGPLQDNPEPTYPPAMLTQRLPTATVRVRLMVNDKGRVYDVQALGQLREAEQPYFAAVESAVSKWQFFPLVKVTDGPGNTVVTIGETSTSYAGIATKLPFHQDYAFSFEQVGGKGVVNAVH